MGGGILDTYNLIIISTFVLYVGITRWKFGRLSDISSTYYKLQGQWKLLFTVFCFGMGIPLIVKYGEYNFMFYVAGGFLMMLGFAGEYRNEIVEKFHVIGATGGIIACIIGLIVAYHSWLPVSILLAVVLILQKSKIPDKTWWIEVVCFVVIMFELMTNGY